MTDDDRWPIERRAAQLVVLPVLDFDVAGVAPLLRGGVGGILFLGNADTPGDLGQQLAAAIDPADPADAPLVMADVEGGQVQRLSGAVQAFPWPSELAATRTPAEVEELAAQVGREMADVGVTVDLAPVLDLDDRPGPSATNPDGKRSFSADAETASAYGTAFVRGLTSAGVVAVAKHFPGLGGSTGNTDVGAAATRPYQGPQGPDLAPFVAAIEAGVPAIMVSHASTPGLTTGPASLSATVIEDLLRARLGFEGLVVTDSLSAGAIADAGHTVASAAVAAVSAGADLVLFGSTLRPADRLALDPANVGRTRDEIVDALAAAVVNGRLPESRLDDAVRHVLATKGVEVCDG